MVPSSMAAGIYFNYLFRDSAEARSKLPKAIWLNFTTSILGITIRYLADQNVFPSHTSTFDAAGDAINGDKFESRELKIKYQKLILSTFISAIVFNFFFTFYYYTVMKRVAALEEN